MKRICCVLLLLALLLAGCGQQGISFDDSAFLPGTTAMLDALLAEDYDSCRNLVTEQVDDEALRSAVTQMFQMLTDVESYTLKPVAWDSVTRNGVTQSSVRYEMQTEAGNYTVEVTLVDGVEGLAGFYIAPVQQSTVTGTLGAMEGAGILQWLVLLVGFAELGFVLWMAVDCLRHKFKGKVGWLLMILLFSCIISLSFAAGKIALNFNVGIYLNHSALLTDSSGSVLLRLYVPAGAIVYWLRRKKLHGQGVENQAEIPESNENPAVEDQEIQDNP